MIYGSWTRYEGIVLSGSLQMWRDRVRSGYWVCPVCFDDKLMTWPANEPTEAPEDRTTACPLCCEQNEFSELP